MKNSLLLATAVVCGLAACFATTVESQSKGPQSKAPQPKAFQPKRLQSNAPANAKEGAKAKPALSAAEAAIRENAEKFAEAFDRADAKALAAHFTADGVYVNEDGERMLGRDSIQKEYETLFSITSGLKMHIDIDSIQLINPTTVVEEGRVALTPQPVGEFRVVSAYTAVHTLQDGKWLMANVRDTRVELAPDLGQLADLDWLVGFWTTKDKDTLVEVKSRWIENKKFLARSHMVTESGKVTSGGLEVIGLDPSTGLITSWNFNSDGSRAVGVWAPHDNGWIVESAGVLSDGTETGAVNRLSRKEDGALLWESVGRFVGDQTLPDMPSVTMKRK